VVPRGTNPKMDRYKRVRSRPCSRPFYVHQYISCTIHHNDAVCNDAIGIIIGRCPPPPRSYKIPLCYICICDRPVARNHYALQCDSCDQWVHIKCDGISKEEYKRFQEIKHLVFECPKCKLFTFTDSFFNKSGEIL